MQSLSLTIMVLNTMFGSLVQDFFTTQDYILEWYITIYLIYFTKQDFILELNSTGLYM